MKEWEITLDRLTENVDAAGVDAFVYTLSSIDKTKEKEIHQSYERYIETRRRTQFLMDQYANEEINIDDDLIQQWLIHATDQRDYLLKQKIENPQVFKWMQCHELASTFTLLHACNDLISRTPIRNRVVCRPPHSIPPIKNHHQNSKK